MTEQQRFELIKEKVQEFYASQSKLLSNDVHVKCLAARLIRYLEQVDDKLDILLEYNYQSQTAYRKTEVIDSISLFSEKHTQDESFKKEVKIRLYPQISILLDDQRYLAIEIHKSTSRAQPAFLISRLAALTNNESPLHYKFGLSINLPTFDTYSKNFKIQVHKPFEQIAVFDFA